MTALTGGLHPFCLGLRSPLATAGASIRHRRGFLVSLRAQGVTGWGEASPLPGWSSAGLSETESALRDALEVLHTHGDSAIDTTLDALRAEPHARAALFGAWSDLSARMASMPLAAHVDDLASRPNVASRRPNETPVKAATGPRERVWRVPVNALIGAGAGLEARDSARAAVRAGYKALKLKVGAGEPMSDVAVVRGVRAAVGTDIELRLDANGAWDQPTAVAVLTELQDCDIAFCEEPVAGVEPIAALSRLVRVPLAVDESIRREADAIGALASGIPVVVVKPQALGGADIALSIARRACDAGAEIVVTSLIDSAVGVSHALHTAVAVDEVAGRRAHGLGTSGLLSADVAEPPPVVDGEMSTLRAPGIGLTPLM